MSGWIVLAAAGLVALIVGIVGAIMAGALLVARALEDPGIGDE